VVDNAVCQAPRSASASATELRRQLHWLSIRQHVTYKIAVITYKTRSTGTPAYLFHLIRDYLPARTLRSSEQLLLTVPRMTLTLSVCESLQCQSSFSVELTGIQLSICRTS